MGSAAARARRRRGRLSFAAAVVLVVAAIRYAPGDVAAFVDREIARFRFSGGSACAAVGVDYERAAKAIGGSRAGASRKTFERTRTACETASASYASRSRGDACRTAASYFGRALERRQAVASVTALRPGGAGTIGVSAAGIVGADDVGDLESMARRMLAECAG